MSTLETQPNPNRRSRRLLWVGGAVTAGAIGVGLLAVAMPANAESTTAVSASATSAPTGQPGQPRQGGKPGQPGQGGNGGGQRAGETLLTGTDAEKAKAAALKALPGATIIRVETDADGAVYEAHVTKSDGSKATVKLDKDFKVTSIEDGMGKGVPQPSATK